VSYRAGHAQTSTTAICSHAIRTADEKTAEAIEGMLDGRKDDFMNSDNR